MLNWKTNRTEGALIASIAGRYCKLIGKRRTQMDVSMDLVACHNQGCPLDLDKLSASEDFDLLHDVGGIGENLDRETGELRNCFVPRCARKEED